MLVAVPGCVSISYVFVSRHVCLAHFPSKCAVFLACVCVCVCVCVCACLQVLQSKPENLVDTFLLLMPVSAQNIAEFAKVCEMKVSH